MPLKSRHGSPTPQAPPPKLRCSREGGSRGYGDGAWKRVPLPNALFLLPALIAVALLLLPRVVLAQSSSPNPSLASAYIEEAKSLFQNNNLAAALEKAKLACDLDPSSSDSFKWLGFFLSKQARKEEAVQALAKAIELGDNSSYPADLLDSLLFSGPFPGWLDPQSLPYLPVTFESFHFDLCDFRLPQSRLKGLDGILTTSLIYPPTVPMPGPGDRGLFNRVCYVFRLNQGTLRYELYLRVAYGSPLLWNLESDLGPALCSIVPAACSFLHYTQAYLPEDAFPPLRPPLDFWLFPEPGEDRWNRDGVSLYDVGSAHEDIDWYKRVYGLLGQRLLFAQGPSGASAEAQAAAVNLVAFWSLLNSRSGPTPTPPALATLQEEALSCLNDFLQNFSPEGITFAQDEKLCHGALLYFCSTSPPDALLQTLSSFASQGTWTPPQIAQPPTHFVKLVLDPLLRFHAQPLQPQDFVRRDPEKGTPLAPGSSHQYWLPLPEGRWRIDFIAKAGSESALLTSLDGNLLAQAAVPGSEWKRFRTEVQIGQPGWHSLEVSVPEGVAALDLRALELRRLAG